MKLSQKEVIKAWLDGARVQYKSTSGWKQFKRFDNCTTFYFNKLYKYRILMDAESEVQNHEDNATFLKAEVI
jgi:hypothetical protein